MSETDIRALDERTVERIAAGEVVERPASVVKELVENALDADASRVSVAVENGGIDGVVVRDDGHGMTEADVRAAVREHTTSKISDVDDLEAGVSTLGFRGEALHTIGAVSRLTIRTRPHDADTGTELVYRGGEIESVEPVGCPAGTTVEVEDLFYNTPAREKYLKSTPTEFAHVNRVARSYALANPDVAVSVTHDDREVFATPGQGDRRAAVLAVYGREVAAAMYDVDDTPVPEGPLDDVSGLVSDPETNRSAREYVSVFVNGRAVSASAVREAILDAYGGQLAPDRYPFTVLFLDVPPGDVDVNVHPRKMEVRFTDETGMQRQVRSVIEETLLEAGVVRSGAPRGRSKAAEADVSPSSSSDNATSDPDESAATAGDRSDGKTTNEEAVNDSTARDAAASTASTGRASDGGASESVGPDASTPVDDESTRSQASGTDAAAIGSSGSEAFEGSSTDATESGDDGIESGSDVTESGSDASEDASADGDAGTGAADPHERSRQRRFGGGTEQATLTGDEATPTGEYDRLPAMTVLGQYRDTYLVAETDDGLVLVDQHAADERVHYEQLRATFEGDVTAQALAEPVELEVTAGEAAAFPAYRDALANLGFHAERVDAAETDSEGADGAGSPEAKSAGSRRVRVSTVPAVFGETLEPADLRDVLAGFLARDGDGEETVASLADAFVADLACYPSVTANTSLTTGSVVELLEALDDCENPFACPHGRPTIVRLEHDDLEGRFERDYPGHGGRREP